MHPSIRKAMDENAAKRRERERERQEQNDQVAAKARKQRDGDERRGA